MATKKQQGPSLIETFAEFKETKNIDRTTLVGVLEESFRNVIAKMFGSDANFDVIVNPDKGDLEIYRNREIVEDGAVTDENTQISLSEAQKIEPDYEVGEDATEKIDFMSFGRRAILVLRQTLASKILELEHDSLYNKYKDRVGELISGEVYQTWKHETLLMDDEDNELLLPKNQQIPRDFFHKGDNVRAVIDRVDNSNGAPKIYLSRTSNDFLLRLPGERAKIAVTSYDDRIDPVGACVGIKGSRIHGIVRELRNENIDVINWTANPTLFIQRALAPAHVLEMNVDEEKRRAEVYLSKSEVSLAIGKGGLNIKLASKLTGYTIDVFRLDPEESSEDIYLDEFSDEIDQWVIEAIKGLGLSTALDVLKTPRDVLVEKADLEEDTVDYVLKVLKAEFEDV